MTPRLLDILTLALPYILMLLFAIGWAVSEQGRQRDKEAERQRRDRSEAELLARLRLLE